MDREQELIAYIKDLGDIADVCTYRYTKEICKGCNCPKKRKEEGKDAQN